MAEAIEDAFRMDKLALCCATFDGDIFPAMHLFLHKLRLKGYQNRRVALVENGSWAPQAVRVMKEMLALEYIKAHADLLQIDEEIFNNWNIHIHVPEGAIPKDGPSAGITMATSLASALTQRKVKAGLAMTGEITLRGKVLPVGGIKEKILAAKRAGITDILICHENRKNIEDIPEKYVKGVTFHYVENVKDVLEYALIEK